jgi:hypothetical protein
MGFPAALDLETQMLATKLAACSYILVRGGDDSKSELRLKRGKLPGWCANIELGGMLPR